PLSTKNEYVKNKLIKAQEIVIEDDAWIGAGAIILPGVRIGRGAVIGAGAVVTRDIPEYSIAVGVPAKPTKDISSYNNEKERLT
ncbi:MAG TPA: DapH/DapD/GlmU-related protein, partial [Defluviitaleaceae bacterium]|nr:DapH/DapD/GlmU-related protein [Defluviitaleaceae bacterium]